MCLHAFACKVAINFKEQVLKHRFSTRLKIGSRKSMGLKKAAKFDK